MIDGDDEYWDEEDDLENYLRTRFEKDGDSSDDEGISTLAFSHC